MALLTCTASSLQAQEPQTVRPDGKSEPAASAKTGKVLYAYRLLTNPPVIDGRLNEEVWARADSFDDFVQWEPNNMAPMTERTVVQVAYDVRYLYVAVRCFDREPLAITAGLGRRDEEPSTDFIGIGVDPRHDHLTGYVFQTNPSGVQSDFSFFDDEQFDRDYDAVWEVGTQITDEGWTAEFRIPFSQMRFTPRSEGESVWGFTLRRSIYRKGESGEWTGRPRGERGLVSRWGHLVFREPLAPPQRLEILPYTLASRTKMPAMGADHTVAAGLDLRLGLGSSSTLSATINPDFGQVELDPAVLNLTIFETFFPEKRPFFLEDSRTFVPPYGLFQLFHSRRIGRTPDRFGVAENDQVVDRPDQTSILGAAKITGKTSGWTYGGMSALTAREYADVNSEAVDSAGTKTVSRVERLIEPLTSYNVARVQRDILHGSSNVGAIVTGVVREKDADAFTGGFDYNLRGDRNRREWNGHWVVTHAPGAGGVRTGVGGVMNVGLSRKHAGFNAHFDHFGRNFRVNDLGFLRSRIDKTGFDTGFRLEQPDPWRVFRRIAMFVGAGQYWNGDRLVFNRFGGSSVTMQFRNFWEVGAFVGRDFRVLDDLDTRGGPPIVSPAKIVMNVFLNSDSRKTWRLSMGAGGHKDEEGGWDLRAGPTLRLQPSARLQASVSTNYNAGRNAAQWIANRDTNDDGVTDYVYGTLQRHVLDVTFRATYAVHRDLTFQLYLQPFVAVGDYTNIRRLARPRSFEFQPTTLPSDPDFNRKSLRGNVVLRWEYVRGSTLFFVWNLSSIDRSRPGVFTPLQDLRDAFTADGTHVFMIKANYWLNR